MNRNKEKLLREYVRNLLLSEDGSGSFAVDVSGGQLQWGVGMGELANAFAGPIADVLKTVSAESQKLLTKGSTLFKVVLEATVSMLIPFVQGEYETIFKNEQETLKGIQDKYRDVYDRTNKALGEGDTATMIFLAAPGPVILKKLTEMSADQAVNVFSALVGTGSSKSKGSKEKSSGPQGLFSSYLRNGNFLFEEKKEKNRIERIKARIDDPKNSRQIIELIEEKIGGFREETIEVYEKTINDALKGAEKVLKAKNVKELPDNMGKKIQEKLEKSLPDDVKKDPEKMKALKESTEEIPKGSLQMVKTAILAPLSKKYEMMKKLGDAKSFPVLKMYEDAIAKIKNMN